MKIPAETQKLMRLLSQVMLADGHIYETEVEALTESASTLGLTDETGSLLTDDNIRHWFGDYLEDINKTWSKTRKDIALTQLILSLSEWPDKQAVVDTLEKISLSDGDYHIEEQKLISIVKAYWQFEGLDAPESKIMS